jgi:hypothetical protein
VNNNLIFDEWHYKDFFLIGGDVELEYLVGKFPAIFGAGSFVDYYGYISLKLV